MLACMLVLGVYNFYVLDGWVGEGMDLRAILRIAYSNEELARSVPNKHELDLAGLFDIHCHLR